jgi:hypothetical protein
MESCSLQPATPELLDRVKLQLEGRTGLNVQAASYKFPVLRYIITPGSAHHA